MNPSAYIFDSKILNFNSFLWHNILRLREVTGKFIINFLIFL